MKKKKIRKELDSLLIRYIFGAEQANRNHNDILIDKFKQKAFVTLKVAKKLKVINKRDYDTCWDIINMMCVGD